MIRNILDEVNFPEDIRNLGIEDLQILASDIRTFLIKKISKTGGHLASSLGAVELTISLHYIFNTPIDKIIWDVGHQTYVHKIITGRRTQFDTLRQLEGLSGFPKTSESVYDVFNTGHSSTSISAALGLAKARDVKGEDNFVIAVIGDGALTGGMSFEALNDAGRSHNNLIVVLNDNDMSIAKNVGGMSKYLNKIRTQPLYSKVKEDITGVLNKFPKIGKSAATALDKVKQSIKCMVMPRVIFEELGFTYLGPVDGHNISELIEMLNNAKTLKGPILIHLYTKKGKGYEHAERNPHIFHGISPFDVETGELIAEKKEEYSTVFGNKLTELGRNNNKIVAITAAMLHGTGLDQFGKAFPERLFDVAIAEQHAVTFGAGLAVGGLIPVVAIYSSFLQRAYDQILHDVALQNLHVVFAIDRAGIVGEDGETHQGIYDISFLRHMPNMTIMSCADYSELEIMLEYAVLHHTGPIAIRYAKGAGKDRLMDSTPNLVYGEGIMVEEGTDATIIAEGRMVEVAMEVCNYLKKVGVSIELINPRFIKPLPVELIIKSTKKTGKVITLEDNVIEGGLGSSVLELLHMENLCVTVKNFGFPDKAIVHGKVNELLQKYELDAVSISNKILKICRS